MSTGERLDRLTELEAAATKAPWAKDGPSVLSRPERFDQQWVAHKMRGADAALIAAARNELLWLVGEARRVPQLEAEHEAAIKELAAMWRERDEARAALQRVRELHQRQPSNVSYDTCVTCGIHIPWPCRTAAALDSAAAAVGVDSPPTPEAKPWCTYCGGEHLIEQCADYNRDEGEPGTEDSPGPAVPVQDASTQEQRNEAADLRGWTDGPHMLAVDGKGYVWRVYPKGALLANVHMWSMAPVNPDNSPIPEPVTYYAPVSTGPAFDPPPRFARSSAKECIHGFTHAHEAPNMLSASCPGPVGDQPTEPAKQGLSVDPTAWNIRSNASSSTPETTP